MKKIMNKLLKNEKGQALPIVLVLLLIGSLFTAPLLGYMGTGLLAGQVHETKMAELYAADAGIEDGLWNLISGVVTVPPQAVLPQFTLNDKTVNVVIDDMGSPTLRITSTAGNTTIEAYVTVPSGFIAGDFNLPANQEIEDSDVFVSGNLTLSYNAEIEHGNVSSLGNITLANDAEIEHGNVCAGGDIILNADAEIEDAGCVCAGGDVILNARAIIQGDVYAVGDVTLANDAQIQGDVYVGGTVDNPDQVTGTIYPYQDCPCSACLAFFTVGTWEIQ